MKKCFCNLGVSILLATPLAARTSSIYVLNMRNNATDPVDVIDPVTNKIVQTIKGIPRPHGAVFSPDGSRAYITSETSEHNLYVVDTKTGEIVNKVLLSGRPNLPAITKDGNRVAVCIRDPRPPRAINDRASQEGDYDGTESAAMGPSGNRVNIVDTTSLSGAVDFVDTTSLKVTTLAMDGPMHDCYTTPDGKYLIAASVEAAFLSVIDLQTQQLAWEIPFDTGIMAIAIEAGPDGLTRRLFLDLNGWHGFAVVDFASHKEVARIEFPDKPGRFMDSVLHKNGPQADGAAIAPDGKTLWIPSWDANAVWVYSLPEVKLLGYTPMPTPETPEQPALGNSINDLIRRPVGARPNWLTFTPDGKTVYVVCGDANLVVAIDVKTRKEVARIPIGPGGEHIFTLVQP